MLPSRPKLNTNRGSLLFPTSKGASFRKLQKITRKATTDRDINLLAYKLKQELSAVAKEAENKGDKE